MVSERGGFIVLHRKLLDSWVWDLKIEYRMVAIQLLLEANWKPTKVFRGGEVIEVPRGSCIISRAGLAKRVGVSPKQIRTALHHLESGGFLAKQPTNHHTLISITNYSKYQDYVPDEGQPKGQQGANDGPSMGQAWATSEQVNKGTREQEDYVSSDVGDADAKKPRKKKTDPVFPTEVKRIAWDLARSVAKNYPETKAAKEAEVIANAKRWCDAIDKLHRIDSQPYERIAAVMAWSQENPFWRQNVRSGDKLRAQFDELLVRRKDEGPRTPPPRPPSADDRRRQDWGDITAPTGDRP